MRLFLFLVCTFHSAVFAHPCQTPQAADVSAECTTPHRWHLSLAAGAGQRSNPLVAGKNLPLLLMPDLSYYGQHWFFDNGTLGYNAPFSDEIQLSVVMRLNEEKGFFRRQHLSNLFNTARAGQQHSVTPIQPYQQQALLPDDIPNRPTALDAGFQLDWFLPTVQLRFNWWHDVSGTYQSHHAKMALLLPWQNRFGHWQFSSSLAWKSEALIHTYYALSATPQFPYRAEASWQPELAVSWSYPLNQQWSLLTFYRLRWLDSAVTDSPLVQENTVRTWFFGLSYQLLE